MHGPPATQPEQQNGRPTWKTAFPAISISQETQVKGYSVLKRRIRNLVKGRVGPKRREAVPWTCAQKLPMAPEALWERG